MKEVNASRLSEKARRQLHREIELHLETKHRYILSCHGAYFVQEEEDTFVHLVLDVLLVILVLRYESALGLQ